MKANQTARAFFIEVVRTMGRLNTDSLEIDMELKDGTQVKFEITAKMVTKPDGTTMEWK